MKSGVCVTKSDGTSQARLIATRQARGYVRRMTSVQQKTASTTTERQSGPR